MMNEQHAYEDIFWAHYIYVRLRVDNVRGPNPKKTNKERRLHKNRVPNLILLMSGERRR